MGYDDIELARYMTPPLTTIHQPKDELGELAIDVLIHRMADRAKTAARAAHSRAGDSRFSLVLVPLRYQVAVIFGSEQHKHQR